MTTKHIMIDLETWGKKPGCDIRSIGACVFDPITGEVFAGFPTGEPMPFNGGFYIATMNPIVDWQDRHHGQPDAFYGKCNIGTNLCHKYGLQRDPETVAWWDNPDRAIAAGEPFANPVDLREALQQFSVWLWSIVPNPCQCIDCNGDQPTHSGKCTTMGLEYADPPYFPDLIALWSHGPAFDIAILAAAYDAVGLPVPWHYRAPRDTRTAFDIADVGDHSAFMQQYNHGTAHHALDDAISQAKAVCGAYARLRISHDVVTHRDAWQQALLNMKNITSDDNGTGYFSHELAAFDRTFNALANHPQLEPGTIVQPAPPFKLDDPMTAKIVDEMMQEGRISCRCGSSNHLDANCPYRGSSPL
jgi:hypothetical protein